MLASFLQAKVKSYVLIELLHIQHHLGTDLWQWVANSDVDFHGELEHEFPPHAGTFSPTPQVPFSLPLRPLLRQVVSAQDILSQLQSK